MDVLPMCSIFQELQIVHETGYFSALPSLEEYWQQVNGAVPEPGAPLRAAVVVVVDVIFNTEALGRPRPGCPGGSRSAARLSSAGSGGPSGPAAPASEPRAAGEEARLPGRARPEPGTQVWSAYQVQTPQLDLVRGASLP